MAAVKIYMYGWLASFGNAYENKPENQYISASAFTKVFNQAKAKATSIKLHLHMYGGEVFEGNLMYNLIKNSDIPVDVYIDGISASMGTIVMLAARRIYMSENAYLMLHSPSGGASGTAKDFENIAKLLRSMEGTFKEVYATRTGKTPEQIAKYLDGDNWFSAKEALAENLIDGIVDPISTAVPQPAKAELKDITPQALFERFTAVLIKPNTNNDMDKLAMIDRYGLTGVTAESSEADILAAIDSKINAERLEKERLQGVIDSKTKAEIGTTIDTQATLKGITLTTAQKENLQKIGETAGLDALKAAMDMMAPAKSIVATLGGGATAAPAVTDRTGWDWDKYQKEDPKALEALQKSDEPAFMELYNAKFNLKK